MNLTKIPNPLRRLMSMGCTDKRTEIITDLILLVESLTNTEAFFARGIRGINSAVTIIVPAKIIPEVKAFCAIHQDILGATHLIPDDICYIPLSSIPTEIVSATPAIQGVISKGM